MIASWCSDKQPDGFSPPGTWEADMATSKTAQLTDFTQDVLGRYMRIPNSLVRLLTFTEITP